MAGDAPDLSGILGSLLENPAALSGLVGLLGGLGKPHDSGKTEAPPPEVTGTEEASDEAISTSTAPLPPPRSGGHGGRGALLDALCPYLSPPRKRALEGARRLLEVLDLLGMGR